MARSVESVVNPHADWKSLIRPHLVYLGNNVDFMSTRFLDSLCERDVLDDDEYDEVVDMKLKKDRRKKLLMDILPRRENNVEKFCSALEAANQRYIVEYLREANSRTAVDVSGSCGEDDQDGGGDDDEVCLIIAGKECQREFERNRKVIVGFLAKKLGYRVSQIDVNLVDTDDESFEPEPKKAKIGNTTYVTLLFPALTDVEFNKKQKMVLKVLASLIGVKTAQVQVKRLETGSLMATLEIPGIAVLHLLHYMAEDMINANLSKLGIVVIEIGLMPRINIDVAEFRSPADPILDFYNREDEPYDNVVRGDYGSRLCTKADTHSMGQFTGVRQLDRNLVGSSDVLTSTVTLRVIDTVRFWWNTGNIRQAVVAS